MWNLLPNLCEVESVSSSLSPSGSKKVEVFVVNCGATTDWSTHASILDVDEVVTDGSRGNVMRIDGNHGKAWPEVGKGWPLIVPVWKDSEMVEFNYSQDSQVFEQEENVNEVEILYKTLTSEFINQNGIQIKDIK